MEPTDLTCPKCGTAWKLIKAGDGPITCPNCKAPVDAPVADSLVPEPAPAPEAAAPIATLGPDEAGRPVAPLGDIPTIPDSAERELRGDYEDQAGPRFPPRRRRHPLLVVLVVLLILFGLLPIAGIVLLFAVCAYSFRLSS